jgi:hypothetical protein
MQSHLIKEELKTNLSVEKNQEKRGSEILSG